MVVGYRTRQLMKSSKYVAACPSLPFSTYIPVYKNFFKPSRRGADNTEQDSLVRLNCACRFHSTDYFQNRRKAKPAKLSPQEVDSILRANEYNHEFSEGPVKSYDSNQLGSNSPMEDTRSESTCLLTKALLVGVFDGHGGGACAQVIAKRLFHYISACLLPQDVLTAYLKSLSEPAQSDLVQAHNDKVQFVDDVRALYATSFKKFLKDLSELGYNKNIEVNKAIERAFLRLDEDLSNEALPKEGEPMNLKTMSVALSGAVACMARIDGANLHTANVGDCCAVLGTLSETNSWIANKLTTEHNSYNQSEVNRIIKEHPYNESLSVIKRDRLLGQLAPLRSMGDYSFKWTKKVLTLVAEHFGEQVIPPNYQTPPYLTALPEVTHRRLTPRDRFLILATDGLWDIMTPLQAVRLVGEHMKGKVTLNPLKLPKKNMTLNEINEMLLQRKEGLKIKPRDSNAATHIIRNALGGTDFGLDHSKISELLTLPEDVVRVFRDDISVTIVYFDSDFFEALSALKVGATIFVGMTCFCPKFWVLVVALRLEERLGAIVMELRSN